MNAYELADYVDAREINNPHLKESATMLRQQADRIAELEKENNRLQDHMTELRKIHTERIEALEKELAYTKAMNGVVFK